MLLTPLLSHYYNGTMTSPTSLLQLLITNLAIMTSLTLCYDFTNHTTMTSPIPLLVFTNPSTMTSQTPLLCHYSLYYD